MPEYQYSLEECDVDDRPLLERFRAKRADWSAFLDDDEHHAIWTTLSDMVWNEVRYSALGAIADANPKGALSNQLIRELALNGHVAIQVLAIRRLVDTTNGVMSLRGLLKDVRKHFDLLTRQNYVCFDGLPYDFEEVQRAEHQRLGPGMRWVNTTGPNAWSSSQLAHERFDKLTGILPSDRSRGDRLPRSLLTTIERWIDESGADQIANWSHQYLAHAGPRRRREQLGEYGLTGGKIGEAIRGLARATEALSAEVLFVSGRAGALMPVAQFDQFEGLGLPVTDLDGMDVGQQRWGDQSDEFDECLSNVGEALAEARRALVLTKPDAQLDLP